MKEAARFEKCERFCTLSLIQAALRHPNRVTIDEVAKALKAEAGSPGLNIIRHYREENGDLMAVSETVHPDDRFTLVTQMRRDRSPA